MKEILKRIIDSVESSQKTEDDLIRDVIEEFGEFGEFCAARTIEKGIKRKSLNESSLVELVDTLINVFALYFKRWDMMDFVTLDKYQYLEDMFNKKIDKWEECIKERDKR